MRQIQRFFRLFGKPGKMILLFVGHASKRFSQRLSNRLIGRLKNHRYTKYNLCKWPCPKMALYKLNFNYVYTQLIFQYGLQENGIEKL